MAAAEQIHVLIPADLLERIDAHAETYHEGNRSAALRVLVRWGLEDEEGEGGHCVCCEWRGVEYPPGAFASDTRAPSPGPIPGQTRIT